MKMTERKCRHFDESLITGCTGSCHFDNFQCSQWWKFHQNEDISVSVMSSASSGCAGCRLPSLGHHGSGQMRQTAMAAPWRHRPDNYTTKISRKWLKLPQLFNSLAPGRCGSHFKSVILRTKFMGTCKIALKRMPQNALVISQYTALSHYPSQCWPRSMPQYGVTKRR